MDLLKALDVLSTVNLKTEQETDRQTKLKALKTVDEQISSPFIRFILFIFFKFLFFFKKINIYSN